MKNQIKFASAVLALSIPGISMGEAALTFEGTAVIGGYSSRASNGGGINLDYTVKAEELSVVDYFYGAEAKFAVNTANPSTGLRVERYEIYVNQNQFRVAFSNDLQPDKTPETKIKTGEGLFEVWQELQPIDGASAYSGALSDATSERDSALLLSGDWDRVSVFIGVDETSASEVGLVFDTDLGLFNFSASPSYGATPSSTTFGASLDVAGTSVIFAASQTPDQNKETAGLKVIHEFAITTLTVSAGSDKGGLATGFRQSIGTSLDFFVGDNALLTVGLSQLEQTSGANKNRSHASYSHSLDAMDLILGFGQDGAEAFTEAGVRFSL